MSNAEFDHIKQQVLAQIANMDAAELAIAARSRESLAFFIYAAFNSIAQLLGYVVTLPLAWAYTMAEGIVDGLATGVRAGWNKGRGR